VTNVYDLVTEYLNDKAFQQAAKVEAACEAAVQGGKHGVFVIQHADGTVSPAVNPLVPYGQIYYWREW
jgi:hypothetical protein